MRVCRKRCSSEGYGRVQIDFVSSNFLARIQQYYLFQLNRPREYLNALWRKVDNAVEKVVVWRATVVLDGLEWFGVIRHYAQ